MRADTNRAIVIGGGFFGMYVAEHLARSGRSVTLFERSDDFMTMASYVNQARVHQGYHYPRSILTAMRSRQSFPRFCDEFDDCIDDDFDKYYMVSRLLSKITSRQFEKFCHRIGAPCEPAPPRIAGLADPRMIEASFRTVEVAFDAAKLRTAMKRRLEDASVDCRLSTSVRSIRPIKEGLSVGYSSTNSPDAVDHISAGDVFNCTYANLNSLLHVSKIRRVHLKYELTELCLVTMPDALADLGITVMCGPFFSTMPFPSRGLHSFSHVRYTPHCEWHDGPGAPFHDPALLMSQGPFKSAWRKMQTDAQRYIPSVSECQYEDSIWTVKTLLPRSERDDSRPILFQPNHELEGFHNLMGAKIDNVYDAIGAIREHGLANG